MDCQWLTKISQLIDNELSVNELDAVRAHLLICQQCSHAYDDFLALRGELNHYQNSIDIGAKNAALNKILRAEHNSPLQKRLLIPAPAFALIVLTVFFVGLFTMRLLATKSTNLNTPQNSEQNINANQSTNQNNNNVEANFAQFDQGKRAAIKVIKRSDLLNNGVTQ